jgi:hypothetical protein
MVLSGALFAGLGAGPVLSQESTFEFEVMRLKDTSVIWRVDRLSGEIGMCRFEQGKRDAVGALVCANRGAGAGIQDETGPYSLKAGRFDDENGMFRINLRTGSASLCYDIKRKDDHRVVCTEHNR